MAYPADRIWVRKSRASLLAMTYHGASVKRHDDFTEEFVSADLYREAVERVKRAEAKLVRRDGLS